MQFKTYDGDQPSKLETGVGAAQASPTFRSWSYAVKEAGKMGQKGGAALLTLNFFWRAK